MAPVRNSLRLAGWAFLDYTALNYEHEEVRNKVYSIIADVCTFDLDGIELDFFRHGVSAADVWRAGHSEQRADRPSKTDQRLRRSLGWMTF